MTTLIGERCVACSPHSIPVTEHEQAELLPLVPTWSVTERDGVPQLVRVFRFKNFVDALAFAQRIGEIAEAEGHHPALLVEWGRVTVSWWSHAIKGLHRNDFVMAAKTDRIKETM